MAALKRLLALALLAAAASGLWFVLRPPGAATILIENARAEAAPEGLAVFLTIVNSGGPDRLVGAGSPDAASARIVSGGGATALAVPAGSSPSLAPDGAHLLLAGLDGPAAAGRLVPVTLEFETAGAVKAQARVAAPARRADASGHDGHVGAVYHVPPGDPVPKLALTVTPGADGWDLTIATRDFAFSRDLADGPHKPGTGHGHLYLDGLKLGRVYAPSIRIGALPPGRYTVRVALNTNDHRIYAGPDGPVEATAVIAVR